MGFSPFFFGANKLMLNRRSDKLELLRIAEAVALEKSIDKELIIDSMETGIAKAAKSKFGQDNEIKVLIDRESGDIGIFRKLIVVEKPENTNTEINLQDAIILNEVNKDKKIGDEILQNFDLSPRGIREMLGLNKPIYEKTSAYGHFGRVPEDNGSFSWEKTDKKDIFSK